MTFPDTPSPMPGEIPPRPDEIPPGPAEPAVPGEPSPMPSRSTAAIAAPILEVAAAGRATAHAPGARVSFRHFEHSGGFDGFEGRMVQRPDGPGRRSRSR